MRAELLALTPCLLLLPLALACGDKDGDSAGDGGSADGGADGGATDASWASVETALGQSCAFSSCHGGYESPNLSQGNAWAAIVGVESQGMPGSILVVPGDPDASYLVAKCEGAEGIEGDPMPKGYDAWEPDKIALLRAWIAAGALEQ